MKIHIIREGDTLQQLAQQYNVPVERLRGANPQIAEADHLEVGGKLKIPTGRVPVVTQPVEEVVPPPQQGERLQDFTAWQGELGELDEFAAHPYFSQYGYGYNPGYIPAPPTISYDPYASAYYPPYPPVGWYPHAWIPSYPVQGNPVISYYDPAISYYDPAYFYGAPNGEQPPDYQRDSVVPIQVDPAYFYGAPNGEQRPDYRRDSVVPIQVDPDYFYGAPNGEQRPDYRRDSVVPIQVDPDYIQKESSSREG